MNGQGVPKPTAYSDVTPELICSVRTRLRSEPLDFELIGTRRGGFGGAAGGRRPPVGSPACKA
jgi:hypothetical protein